jgi:hypothetical protein
MAQILRTSGIILAIALYSTTAGAAGSEAKAPKTSHASTVHRVKVLQGEAKAAQTQKAKVAVASKAMLRRNATKYKPIIGERPKPSEEKSNDASLPIVKKVPISISDDHPKFAPASDSSAPAPAELQSVNAGEKATIREIYATVIKTQQIYVPQKPGCDAIGNYRQLRLSDADDWRRITCLQASGSDGFGISQ